MKEATGELNMTVITVVAIAAVAAFFYAFVWPGIKRTIEAGTYCAMATCDPAQCKVSGNYMICSACVAENAKADGSDWSGKCKLENAAPSGK